MSTNTTTTLDPVSRASGVRQALWLLAAALPLEAGTIMLVGSSPQE